jgi:hypothetical protein
MTNSAEVIGPPLPVRVTFLISESGNVGGVERYGSFQLVVEHQERCHFGHLCVSFVFRSPPNAFS